MTDVIAGRFALCDPIARGGTGVVWRAWDRKVERFCAAKVLRRRDAGDLLRFAREQSVRLAHPHVLTPYSWAAEDEHVVIASELVTGGSLSTLLGDYGALSEPTVAALLDQLLDALDHVHQVGLVHRDVKLGNVLLPATRTGPIRALLADFGLAMSAGDARLTQAGMVVGTPGYLPPELLVGGVTPEPGHDLYAAGRAAAALLTGTEPAAVDERTDLDHVRDPALRTLVAALVSREPAARPASAAHARHALTGAARDLIPRTVDGDPVDVLDQLPPLGDQSLGTPSTTGVTARPAGNTLVAPARPPTRRRRWLIAVAAIVVAGAGIPLGLALTRDSGGGAPPESPPTPATPDTSAAVGNTCTWQQEGDRESAQGQVVVCTKVGNSYVWRAAP